MSITRLVFSKIRLIYLALFIITLVILITFLFYVRIANKDNSTVDPSNKCRWSPPEHDNPRSFCEQIVPPGYFFSTIQKKCVYFKGDSSGCSLAPFKSREDCKVACEE